MKAQKKTHFSHLCIVHIYAHNSAGIAGLQEEM